MYIPDVQLWFGPPFVACCIQTRYHKMSIDARIIYLIRGRFKAPGGGELFASSSSTVVCISQVDPPRNSVIVVAETLSSPHLYLIQYTRAIVTTVQTCSAIYMC